MKVTERVKDYLSGLDDLGRARLYLAADHLCMATTTLGANLAREGSSFRRLLNAERAVRLAAAVSLDPDLTMNQLAAVAGVKRFRYSA